MVPFSPASGFDFDAPDTRPGRGGTAMLCVHFAGRGSAHVICFTDPARASEVDRARAARLVVEWDEDGGPLLRGRALLRGEVACDAYLLAALDAPAHTPARDRELLRAAGFPRDRASLLARMPERPLLATAARGPAPSPQLLRRIHSLLLAGAATVARP